MATLVEVDLLNCKTTAANKSLAGRTISISTVLPPIASPKAQILDVAAAANSNLNTNSDGGQCRSCVYPTPGAEYLHFRTADWLHFGPLFVLAIFTCLS